MSAVSPTMEAGVQSPATVIAEFAKNGSETVRIILDEYRGHPLVTIRAFYEDRDGEMRATRKGLSLNVALLPELIEGLREALAQAETAGRLYGEA